MFKTTRLDDRLNTGLIAIVLGTLVGLAAHGAWNEIGTDDGQPVVAQASSPAAVNEAAFTANSVVAASRYSG
jgi:hypothetical protein